ncbi:uncharacterized protein [Procambarus clarkii]|uniref:uncharacterized protein n=1 Tax=Procambarus clarkii TaxID=6728 RepID=UPI0037443EC7
MSKIEITICKLQEMLTHIENDLSSIYAKIKMGTLRQCSSEPLASPRSEVTIQVSSEMLSSDVSVDTSQASIDPSSSAIGIRHRFPSHIKYWIKRAQQETYGSKYENLPDKLTKSLGIWRYDARVCPYAGPPPLPKERVVHLRPFETTGVNYTGALILTGTPDRIPVETYICLFTYATTRGEHLEVTSDMSAEAFIQAFRRFAALRSSPKSMISDNGLNFVAGEACLREIWNHPEV